MNSQNKILTSVMLLGLVLGVSGCKWWPFDDKKKSDVTSHMPDVDHDQVLLTINGVPVLTVQEYEEQLDMARQANPQVDALLNMMPNAEKDFVFKGVATGKLMKAWAENKGIDKSSEFQKQRKQLHEAMDLQLYMKHFDEAHPVHISDADLKKFYEEKKDVIPGLMSSPGGVQVSYVRLDSKEKAEDFLKQVKDVKSKKDFKEEAEKEKLSSIDDTINQKSHLSEPIKNAVLASNKFPTTHLVKVSDNSYWVIFAASKSDAKYLDFNTPQVQQGLKKMAADEQKEKQLEKLMDQLKKELNVKENSSYFEEKEMKKRSAMEAEKSKHQVAGHQSAHDAVEHEKTAVKV